VLPSAAAGLGAGIVLAWALALLRPGHRNGHRAKVLCFGAGWYLVACLPLLVTYHSPRHLYLPMAGPCVALACLAESGWVAASRRAAVVRIAAAVALVLLTAVLLGRQNVYWRTAGVTSATLAREFPAALRAVPPDALVIARTPLEYNKAYAWIWVLPFALQPPFVPEDLYTAARMIEIPDMYCCPLEQWWQRKRPILLAALAGDALPESAKSPPPDVTIYRLDWDEENRRLSRLQVTVPQPRLRALIEQALGIPIEQADFISNDSANRLMTALMDLTVR
jgi:hypothetical protein